MFQWVALSRPDLQFPSKELARSLKTPKTKDKARIKKTARYARGTMDLMMRLVVKEDWPLEIVLVVDASHAQAADRKSTSGYFLFLQGLYISSASKTQTVIAKSAAEAELIALSTGVSEAMFLRELLRQILQ